MGKYTGDPEDSPFYSLFETFPENFTSDQIESLKSKARTILSEEVSSLIIGVTFIVLRFYKKLWWDKTYILQMIYFSYLRLIDIWMM